MMENRKYDGSDQKGEENHDFSEPIIEDLDALQAGIREGLREDHAVEDASQGAAVAVHEKVNGPQSVTELASRSQAIAMPRGEEDPMDMEPVNEANDPLRDQEVTDDFEHDALDTTTDDPIHGPDAQGEQGPGAMDVDSFEESVEPHSATKSTRIPFWQRELTASTTERERVTSAYGLRQRPIKTRQD